MGAPDPLWPLTGRDEELHLLARVVASGPVVVGGRAGIGKTRLVADWSERKAATRPVIAVTATAATATIPFGAFAAWVPAHLDGSAAQVTTLRAIAAEILAIGQPVVTVDDAHLLDDASAALVLHLAQHTPADVVATVRSGEPCPDAVTALWRDTVGTRIELRDLSQAETSTLLNRRVGGRVHPVTQQRLWSLSLGNPMYLHEVTEAALAQGQLRPVDGTWTWEGDLAGAPRLVELVEQRLGRLDDPEDRRALDLVAFGEPLALAVLGRLVTPTRIEDLERRGLLVLRDEVGEPRVGLIHPLYAEVLRATALPLSARHHRADLVQAVLADDRTRTDPLRVATWILEGGADDADPDLLLDAARRAAALRDDELAVRLAEAADRAGAGAPALLLRARALADLGDDDEHDRAMAALADHPDPAVRSEAIEMRAFRLCWDRHEETAARQVIDDALTHAPSTHRTRLSALAATLSLYSLDLDRAIDHAASSLSSPGADDGLRLQALTCAGMAAALRGQPDPIAVVLDTLLDPILAVTPSNPVPPGFAATGWHWAMILAGRVDEAVAFFDAVLAGSEVTLSPAFRALPTLLLGRLATVQGRVGAGADHLQDAIDLLGGDSRYWFGRPAMAAAELAVAAAQAGDVERARRALATAEARNDGWIAYARTHLAAGQAWTAAATGELGRAAEIALASAEAIATRGAPTLEVVALATAARVGAAAEAAPRLTALAEQISVPYASALACFAGALATADGPGLDDASARLEATGARLVAAEAAAQAATLHANDGLRRREAAARRRAHDLLTWCGPVATPLLAGFDHREVTADLTAREREIALMASDGRSNREIAEALGVSLRTVNSHLNHAYTKLGTSDRPELARLLGPPGGDGR